jgi:membrane associated rhomboid family serine protease
METRNDVEHALPCAEGNVVVQLRRVLHQVPSTFRCPERVLRAAPRAGETRRRLRRIGSLRAHVLHDPPGDERIVEGKRALHACTDEYCVLPRPAYGIDDGRDVHERRDEDALASRGRGDDRLRPVRGRQDEGLAEWFAVLAGGVSEVEPWDEDVRALASEHAVAELRTKRAGLVDLGGAEDAGVAGCQRLADRGRRANHVDDDSGRGPLRLGRSERDVNAHLGTLAAVTEALHCYRHPNRETYVSCSECGRGICPECMVFGPVGIRCPDHARGAGIAPRQRAKITARRFSAPVGLVTRALIAVNLAVYLLELATGAGINGHSGWIYEHGVLISSAIDSSGHVVGVAEGDWWRLITAAFLHYGPVHIGMNMLVLWFIGPALEEYFGRLRYLLVYLVAGLAGSAGALIVSPNALTVGASGAIWGLMGAAVLLEARRINVFGGQAMGLVVFNLIFTLLIPGVSLGGHIGGGIGGAAAALAITSLRRTPALATLTVAAIGVVSVAVALYAA